MADGVRSAVVTFKQVLAVTQGRQPLPHMRQLVGSYEIGERTKDASLCHNAFQCEKKDRDLDIKPAGEMAFAL